MIVKVIKASKSKQSPNLRGKNILVIEDYDYFRIAVKNMLTFFGVKAIDEAVNGEEAIDKMPSELSGGMRKRIGLARSIITDPDLMLYDEPTTGLDPITAKEISELIINLQKKLNMTSIAVTHDLVCAKIIADRAIFLKDSVVAYEGNIKELTDSNDPFLRNFFSQEIIKA